jgi:hypothetical protein
MATTSPNLSALTEFNWKQEPDAEKLVRSVVDDVMARNPFAEQLAGQMKAVSGTRIYDWVGHLSMKVGDPRIEQLDGVGYKQADFDGDPINGGMRIFANDRGVFPKVVVFLDHDVSLELGIKVDSVADFLAVHQINTTIYGEPGAIMRYAVVSKKGAATLSVIERHGSKSFGGDESEMKASPKLAHHLEQFRFRLRALPVTDDARGFEIANRLIDLAIADLGQDVTCDLFFNAEREFWMRRNRAAQVQYARQQKLGLGWANHDHHTYRSSRANFKALVATWEKLGLVCRERFYAGLEAGWGAQVMEQPVTGIVTFNDVDLSPEELMGDFSHDGLNPKPSLGTIGLWCGLHGDSFLQAGMHHLECQFDFEQLRTQLEHEHGIKTMKPFTDYTYLRQAFTEGERFAVNEDRIEALFKAKLITGEQAENFRVNGALGSHLENLERNEGFKGFNQKGVSEIISATDPRKQKPVAAAV